MKNFSVRSFATFLVVGGFATALHYALTALLYLGAGLPLVVASTIGFAISAVVNYVLTARHTFRSAQSHRVTAPRFVVTAGTGLAINSALLPFFVSAGLTPAPAQLCTTVLVILWNYAVNGIWTFRERAR